MLDALPAMPFITSLDVTMKDIEREVNYVNLIKPSNTETDMEVEDGYDKHMREIIPCSNDLHSMRLYREKIYYRHIRRIFH